MLAARRPPHRSVRALIRAYGSSLSGNSRFELPAKSNVHPHPPRVNPTARPSAPGRFRAARMGPYRHLPGRRGAKTASTPSRSPDTDPPGVLLFAEFASVRPSAVPLAPATPPSAAPSPRRAARPADCPLVAVRREPGRRVPEGSRKFSRLKCRVAILGYGLRIRRSGARVGSASRGSAGDASALGCGMAPAPAAFTTRLGI